MESEEFMKKEYESELQGPSGRGRPLGKWKNTVEEYCTWKRELLMGDECLKMQGGRFGIGKGGVV